jgi:hypothetical protein
VAHDAGCHTQVYLDDINDDDLGVLEGQAENDGCRIGTAIGGETGDFDELVLDFRNLYISVPRGTKRSSGFASLHLSPGSKERLTNASINESDSIVGPPPDALDQGTPFAH